MFWGLSVVGFVVDESLKPQCFVRQGCGARLKVIRVQSACLKHDLSWVLFMEADEKASVLDPVLGFGFGFRGSGFGVKGCRICASRLEGLGLTLYVNEGLGEVLWLFSRCL